MRKLVRIAVPAIALGALIVGAVVLVAPEATAAKPKPPGSGCPRTGIACIDLWDPVICSDGNVYSNGCYAYVACATGCVPYGDGGPVAVE
jgi:hypothetical protein